MVVENHFSDVSRNPRRRIHDFRPLRSFRSMRFAPGAAAMMATLLISSFPLLVLYGIFKEKLIEGLTAGAVKG